MKLSKTPPDLSSRPRGLACKVPTLALLLLPLIAAAVVGCTSDTPVQEPAVTASPVAEMVAPTATDPPIESEPSATSPLPPPSPTAEPTATVASLATVELSAGEVSPTTSPQPSPQIQPTTVPTIPTSVNGVPIETIVVMDEATRQNVREIFAHGQLLGRDPATFSKLGDSLIANPYFLTGFDKGPYDLGEYDYLQPVIDQYAGSYERYGVAIKAGLHSWAVFDPIWADKDWCQANESIIECEFRLNNPSVLLVLLGSNDAGSPGGFNFNIRKIVEFSIENGVVPVLATKADRFDGPENSNNIMIREIAADFKIPLWEFDLLADTLPGRGLQDDGIHLTFFTEYDYTMPEAYQRGHGVHNLTALMVLDAIRREVIEQEGAS
jgi:hypothetical protein